MRSVQPRRSAPERRHSISLGDSPEITKRIAALQQLQQHMTARRAVQQVALNATSSGVPPVMRATAGLSHRVLACKPMHSAWILCVGATQWGWTLHLGTLL